MRSFNLCGFGRLCGIGTFSLAAALSLTAQQALAYDDEHHAGHANGHAPIGVMGEHMHDKGEWMLSYRFMRMEMDGSRQGSNQISPEEIATTVANPFAGPATLRVVPTEMSTEMHMLGGMYAPSDNITLMAMVQYLDREMDHVTFQGGAGTTRLGNFTTRAQGFGDTTVSSLIKLYEDETHHLHLNAGLSLPTGSTRERDTVLTPMNTRPELRLPYAMQLGSGTYDAMPGITYTGKSQKMGWGAQYTSRLPLGRNSQNYSLGDKHMLSAWGSYLFAPSVSASFRVTGETESEIDGQDIEITAPVQTADPDNYGGERISASLGINTVVTNGALTGHRFSAEVTLPVHQNLNGAQLERESAFTLGWSKSF